MFKILCSVLVALPLAHALGVPISSHNHDHVHEVKRSLPDTWHQPDDHPVKALFKRATNDGVEYPEVGSPVWTARFPASTPDASALPQEWLDALTAAEAAGRIPNIPIPTDRLDADPVYPEGVDSGSPEICSATVKCKIPGHIWDAPDGVFATSFDDGPQPYTPKLLDFFKSNNIKTTHFMIGSNILKYPQEFLGMLENDHDLAVHTYTHPYMTPQSNRDVVAQLGWTMQIIHDSSGGRVPRYWRPPYGDTDMRVSAIAKEVFGLETVIWNQITDDHNKNPAEIQGHMTMALTGPKSPGLVILEHETSDEAVNGFIDAYPLMVSNGWQIVSLARAYGNKRAYQNAAGTNSNDVVRAGIVHSFASRPPISTPIAVKTSTSTPPASKTSPVTPPPSPTKPVDSTQNQLAPSVSPTPTGSASSQWLGTGRMYWLSALAILVTTCIVS